MSRAPENAAPLPLPQEIEAPPGIPRLAGSDFAVFRDLLLQDTGVLLSDQKRDLLIARLSKRVRALGLDHFGDYLQQVIDDPRERGEMVDRMMTNETRFFREPVQFEFLERTAIPRWADEIRAGRRAPRLRIWSAGCSTGQEPASIAMTMLAGLPGRDVEILATDISRAVLRQASTGTWPAEKAAEIPQAHLRNFMLRGKGSSTGLIKCGDRVRSMIDFRRLNLNAPFPPLPLFDAIFCRNVLIYFDPEARRRAIARLLSRLAPGGYFFLGHAESLVNTEHRLATVAPSVYVREVTSD